MERMVGVKRERDGNSEDYEMMKRSTPLRRDPREDTNSMPLFLRKAHAVISNCPPDIGGWSASGDSFVIKEIERFAREIIPTTYKVLLFPFFLFIVF